MTGNHSLKLSINGFNIRYFDTENENKERTFYIEISNKDPELVEALLDKIKRWVS